MSNVQIISNVLQQLKNLMLSYFKDYETNKDKLKIQRMIEIIKNEIEKLKRIKLKFNELQNEIKKNNFYNSKLIQINNYFKDSICILNHNNNIFNLNGISNDQSKKDVSFNYILQKDLVNFSLRINSNYLFPEKYNDINFIPKVFNNPYPLEDKEFKESLLKFDLDENKRAAIPNVKPEEGYVKKGSILQFTYPDKDSSGVFYKFTINSEYIPTYFSGILVTF